MAIITTAATTTTIITTIIISMILSKEKNKNKIKTENIIKKKTRKTNCKIKMHTCFIDSKFKNFHRFTAKSIKVF